MLLADLIERIECPRCGAPLPQGRCDEHGFIWPSTAITRRYVPLERFDRMREALHTIAYWRGPLTAADAGTMCMTARAALDASSREQRQ